MRDLLPSTIEFLESAKKRVHVTKLFDVTPDVLWALIADQSTWAEWCGDCNDVSWLSADRACVGAVRRALFKFGTFEERMLAWDDTPDDEGARRIVFSVERASSLRGVVRVAEEWLVDGDDDDPADPNIAFLHWTMAVETSALGSLAWPIASSVIESSFAKTARGIERYFARRAR